MQRITLRRRRERDSAINGHKKKRTMKLRRLFVSTASSRERKMLVVTLTTSAKISASKH